MPVLGALRSWLNSWRGIGDVERGMAHQGYDLQLTRRATFYTTGMEHSIGLMRQTRHRGSRRVGWMFVFSLAVYNLVRIRNLAECPA